MKTDEKTIARAKNLIEEIESLDRAERVISRHAASHFAFIAHYRMDLLLDDGVAIYISKKHNDRLKKVLTEIIEELKTELEKL